jgi:hypothetical protein
VEEALGSKVLPTGPPKPHSREGVKIRFRYYEEKEGNPYDPPGKLGEGTPPAFLDLPRSEASVPPPGPSRPPGKWRLRMTVTGRAYSLHKLPVEGGGAPGAGNSVLPSMASPVTLAGEQ